MAFVSTKFNTVYANVDICNKHGVYLSHWLFLGIYTGWQVPQRLCQAPFVQAQLLPSSP